MKKIVYLLLSILISNTTQTSMSLYPFAKNIEELNVTNFYEKVENSKSAWLVEYYLVSCGFCQGFALTWSTFAIAVSPWKDMLKIGVVACSDEFNVPLCRDFHVKHVPTLKYFHEGYKKTPTSLGVQIDHQVNGIKDIRDVTPLYLKQLVIEQIQKEISEERGTMYPNLMPFTGQRISRLFKGVKNSAQHVFLILQKTNDTLGAEIAMDFYNKNGDNLPIRYSNNNKALSSKLKVKKYPALVAFPRKERHTVISEGITTKPKLINKLTEFLKRKCISFKMPEIVDENEFPNYEESKDPEKTALREHLKKLGDVVFQRDLESALRTSLKMEIAVRPVIQGQELEALNTYLLVIKKYFPFGYDSFSFINNLTSLTSTVPRIKGSEISEIVTQAEKNGIFSTTENYLGCLGSVIYKRGFTCSMWHLFHFLTVNAAEANSNNTDSNPQEILYAMHTYVKNFFLCADCRNHFLKMAIERNITNVWSWDESILWLWRSHNVVNKRLGGKPTEDKEYPKVQFPAEKNCPSCHGEGVWNVDEVLKYLKKMYGKYNIRYIGVDTSILFPGLRKKDNIPN